MAAFNATGKVLLDLCQRNITLPLHECIQFAQLRLIKSRLAANRLILRFQGSKVLPLTDQFFDGSKADRKPVGNLLFCTGTGLMGLYNPMP